MQDIPSSYNRISVMRQGVGLSVFVALAAFLMGLLIAGLEPEATNEERQAEALAECLASGGTATTNSITYSVKCTIEPKE